MALNTIPSSFGQIDVEDSHVVAVRRAPGTVVILFDGAQLWAGQQNSDTGPLSVTIDGVTSEAAILYGAEEVALSVAGDDVPLNVVELLDYSAGILQLEGMRGREPWCVWRIEGVNVSLNWKGVVHSAVE